MKIGIDAIGIEKASGGRTATLNLLLPLFEIDRENQYLVAVSSYEPLFERAGKNVQQWIIPTHNRFMKRVYAQTAFPYKMRDCQVVHFTKNLSLLGPMPPKIVTVFDLSMLLYPGIMAKSDLLYWKTVQRFSLRDARCVITISKSAARDIVRFYGIPEDKIRVIYPGISNAFHSASPEEIARVRAKYDLPDHYLIHVGRIDPIKNLSTLVKAFAMLRKRGVYNGKLVLVGQIYKKTPDLSLLPTISSLGLQDEVILAGLDGNFISDQDLPAVLSGAQLKVFPSLNEGFGFAPLEAMACGTPVIASRAGSLPEVLGDAAILTGQNNAETLAQEMERVILDPDLQNNLRARGLEHVRQYNWYENARQTLCVYQEFSHK